MKKRFCCLTLALALLLSGCGLTLFAKPEPVPPTYSNLADQASHDEVYQRLKNAGLPKPCIRTVLGWANDYNRFGETVYDYPEGFVSPEGEYVDYGGDQISSEWLKKRDFPDVSPRVAAFALLKSSIRVSRALPEEVWADAPGLQSDRDALDTNPLIHWEELEKSSYFTLFSPVSVDAGVDGEEKARAVADAWKEREVSLPRGEASLITLWAPKGGGYLAIRAGVLVSDREGVLFIEKTGAYQPYQVWKCGTKEQMRDYLLTSAKAELEREGSDPSGLFVLENDRLL